MQYSDVRKEARNGEIDSLAKAKAVLSGADFSMVQMSLQPPTCVPALTCRVGDDRVDQASCTEHTRQPWRDSLQLVNIDAQNPSKLSPGSSKPELQTVVDNLSQILPRRPGKFHVAGLGEPGASAVVSSTTCALAKQLSSLRMHD